MTPSDAHADHNPQPDNAPESDSWWLHTWWKFVAANATALILAVFALASIWILARPLALIFFGAVIAAALNPIAHALERIMPRVLVAGVIVVTLLLTITLLVVLLIPAVTDDAAMFQERVPELVSDVEEWLHDRGLLTNESSLEDEMSSRMDGVVSHLVTVPLTIFTGVVDALLVFVMALYFLIEAHSIRDFALSLVPERRREGFLSVVDEMLSASGAYVRGVIMQSAIIGSLSYVGFLVIGLEFPLLLAIIMGVTEIFPIIGPVIGGAIAVGVALLTSPTTALVTLVFAILLQQVESNLITPYVMHKQVDISPLMVVIAVFAGGAVGGITGALVAIPLMASVRVFVVRVVAPAIRRHTGATADSGE